MQFALSWAAAEIAEKQGVEVTSVPLGEVTMLIKIDGLWSRLCAKKGFTEAMRLVTTPSAFMKYINPYGEAMMREMNETYIAAGQLGKRGGQTTHIIIADDVSTSIGWVVAEDIVRDALMTVYAKMITAVHNDLPFSRDEFNVAWGFHSDGDISTLYPAVAMAGFEAVHFASVPQSSVSSLADKARASGLTACGGVTAESLEAGKLPSETCRQIAILARRPNFIVCDDGGMTTKRQLEHYLEALHQIALC
ncbi:MAG: hypothetical protein FWG78_00270 [Coriobacteriia bacterium]|nr:hypothetical protein [Coriobacteriia bacterium]